MHILIGLALFWGIFAIILGDIWSNKVFTNKVIAGISLIFAPHFVVLFYYISQIFFAENTPILLRIIIYFAAAVLLVYFNCRISLFPIHSKQDINPRAKIIYGGRRLIYYSLYLGIIQIILYVFLNARIKALIPIPDSIFAADAIVAGIYILLLLLNGILRVFCLSQRLRVVRRVIVCWTVWIPFVNIFVLLYLCRVAAAEYDHECNKVINRNARVDSEVCKTKYPIVMLHGVGFRDFKYINYWGRIPKELIRNGAVVYYGNQEAWGTVKDNAADVKNKILEVMQETGCEKVNIIAHSKGGLDARYMISMLEMGDKVATLTTMNSPHRGCRAIDYACKMPKKLLLLIGRIVNWYYRKIGDKNPDFYTAVHQFRTEYLKTFNEEVFDVEDVYYQSYTSVMKGAFSDFLLAIPYIFIKAVDGANDGLVTIESAKWGEFKGVITNKHRRGISHGDIIDLKREDYKGFDPIEKFVGIVSELKRMGY